MNILFVAFLDAHRHFLVHIRDELKQYNIDQEKIIRERPDSLAEFFLERTKGKVETYSVKIGKEN